MSQRSQPSSRDGRVLVNLRILPELLARVDAEAEKRVVSRNLVIQAAVLDWLSGHEGEEILGGVRVSRETPPLPGPEIFERPHR